MTWIYKVREAGFYRNGIYQFTAEYAGARGYYNDPEKECVKNKGPLPRGKYRIEAPRRSSAGNYALPLTPDASNNMCGRNAFMIHGDSSRNPGGASQGCIVLRIRYRREIWESNDRELIVE